MSFDILKSPISAKDIPSFFWHETDLLAESFCKALPNVLFPYSQHSEMAEENIQLKTLQTILIIFQSRLHPETEVNKTSLV